jgi:hypothetical protein
MKENKIDWRKHYVSMKYDGWCGVYTVKMIFNACGIKKSVYEIALFIWKWWYGSSYILLVAYLKRFFNTVNFKLGATIGDIVAHLKLGHICILNFQDDGEGHYALAVENNGKFFTIVDPSPSRDWQYAISKEELKKIWWDTIDLDNTLYHTQLLIWCDPKSKKVT